MRSVAWPGPITFDVTIFQGRGMSSWQLGTSIVCVGFRKLVGLDLEGLVSGVDLVILEMLILATLSRSSGVKICQGRFLIY